MPGLSFLTDRMQSVVISEAWSDIASVYSGLPQGFVLDPSLFLLTHQQLNHWTVLIYIQTCVVVVVVVFVLLVSCCCFT